MPWREAGAIQPTPVLLQQNESEGEDGFKRVRRFDLCCVCSQDPMISAHNMGILSHGLKLEGYI